MPKKDRSTGIHYRRGQNEIKTCEHPRCTLPRRGLSRYCSKHEGQQQRYGHPDGHYIYPRDYACETEEVKAFIERHIDHKEVQAAINWFQGWVSDSTLGKSVPGGNSLRRLNDHGVTGRRCLEAIMAFWLFAYRRPGAIPHDVRLDFALALSLLRLAPEEKKVHWMNGEMKQHGKHIGYRIRKDVGVYIRQTLYILAKNMVESINKELDKENGLKIALAKEFK
jgi:tetrahydromethanopterin S-methyltransferase subunit G